MMVLFSLLESYKRKSTCELVWCKVRCDEDVIEKLVVAKPHEPGNRNLASDACACRFLQPDLDECFFFYCFSSAKCCCFILLDNPFAHVPSARSAGERGNIRIV